MKWLIWFLVREAGWLLCEAADLARALGHAIYDKSDELGLRWGFVTEEGQ